MTQSRPHTQTDPNKNVDNLFIHGTTSLVLANLAKTEFQLLPFILMLEKYNLAPFGGELDSRGGNGREAGETISFGLFNSPKPRGYNCLRILNNYASTKNCQILPSIDELLCSLSKRVKSLVKYNFVNIGLILLDYAKARQLGANNETIEQKVNIKSLIEILQDRITLFYFILCALKKYIIQVPGSPERYFKTTGDPIIVKKIKDANLDMKAIYETPTQHGLDILSRLFDINRPSSTSSTQNERLQHIANNFENIKINQPNITGLSDNPMLDEEAMEFVSQLYGHPTSSFGMALTFINKDPHYPRLNAASQKEILEQIKLLDCRIKLLQQLQQADYPALSKQALFFINNQFPIVFMTEQANGLSLFDQRTDEYRTTQPLKIGKDIKLIATDNERDRLIIMKFLGEEKVYNVSVVLFDDLLHSLKNGNYPASPYTHPDNLERLSWLAAKALADTVFTSSISNDSKANKMVEIANTYRSIKLSL